MRPAKPVRIVVVGDAGVGKSSLITAAATESFPEHPPPVLPPTRLAHDTTPEGVPMVLVDTSSRPEDKANFELACRHADVVILCFDSGLHDDLPVSLHIVCEASADLSSRKVDNKADCRGCCYPAPILLQQCLTQEVSGTTFGEATGVGPTRSGDSGVVLPCRPPAVAQTYQ